MITPHNYIVTQSVHFSHMTIFLRCCAKTLNKSWYSDTHNGKQCLRWGKAEVKNWNYTSQQSLWMSWALWVAVMTKMIPWEIQYKISITRKTFFCQSHNLDLQSVVETKLYVGLENYVTFVIFFHFPFPQSSLCCSINAKKDKYT